MLPAIIIIKLVALELQNWVFIIRQQQGVDFFFSWWTRFFTAAQHLSPRCWHEIWGWPYTEGPGNRTRAWVPSSHPVLAGWKPAGTLVVSYQPGS